MFPILVAASSGADRIITQFIRYRPSSAGLPDSRGRTFLHIAAEKSEWKIVAFVSWILNMQDTDGNSALHVAVQSECLRSFCPLLGNPRNTEVIINMTLSICGAKLGSHRPGHFIETCTKSHDYQRKEAENLKDSTQTMCIGSVLIATMAFGAIFAVPGGYRADDHTNRGTPTLAGRYPFDAFMMTNTLTFICSWVATMCLMISGFPFVELKSQSAYFLSSMLFAKSSVTSLSAAFALGVYMVLGPIAHKTADVISVMSPLVVTCASINGFLFG
ncbi:hypothetical protein EJB05_01158, partial [Eragrostis curvula]